MTIYYLKPIDMIRKTLIILLAIPALIMFILNSCKKEELPEKDYWAPQNFWILDSNLIIKKLIWNYYGPSFIDGFRIDRREGNSPWVRDYATLSSYQREWLDTNITTYPKTIYEYNIYAFKGNEKSAAQSKATSSAFKAPSIKLLELTNDQAFATLTWEVDYNFEPVFVIDRKSGQGDWIEKHAIVVPGSTYYVDSNLYRSDALQYRIHAIYLDRESERDSVTLRVLEPATKATILRSRVDKIEMTWNYENSSHIDGFRVKRKYSNTDWQIVGETTSKHFDDTTFMLNQSVVYSIHAFKGIFESDPLFFDFNSNIPPPENVYLKNNSINSVSVYFDTGLEGIESYTLERRYANNEWFYIDSAGPEVTEIEDNTVIIEPCFNNIQYRLTSNYYQYQSVPVNIVVQIGLFIDERDGYLYETVNIGNQCWMRENMRYLPAVSNPNTVSYSVPVNYVYGNYGTDVEAAKNTSNYQIYGALYNYAAANIICPEGWRLPSREDWEALIKLSVHAKNLKEKGNTHWHCGDGTDKYNFTALPAGYMYSWNDMHRFENIHTFTYYWINTSENVKLGCFFHSAFVSHNINRWSGLSVRCIKNQ